MIMTTDTVGTSSRGREMMRENTGVPGRTLITDRGPGIMTEDRGIMIDIETDLPPTSGPNESK